MEYSIFTSFLEYNCYVKCDCNPIYFYTFYNSFYPIRNTSVAVFAKDDSENLALSNKVIRLLTKANPSAIYLSPFPSVSFAPFPSSNSSINSSLTPTSDRAQWLVGPTEGTLNGPNNCFDGNLRSENIALELFDFKCEKKKRLIQKTQLP